MTFSLMPAHNDQGPIGIAWGLSSVTTAALTRDGGFTWTALTLPFGVTNVCYCNRTFVAIANNATGNKIAYSTDGVTWVQATLPTTDFWFSLACGNGIFIASTQTSGANQLAVSTNGQIWSLHTAPGSGGGWEIFYAGGLFHCTNGGGASVLYSSADGINWTSRTLPTSQQWGMVASDDSGHWILCGGASNATSTDGVTWATSPSAGPGELYGMAFTTAGRLICAPQTTASYYSTNFGSSWNTGGSFASSGYGGYHCIGYSQKTGNFCCVRNTAANVAPETSADGLTWTAGAGLPTSQAWYGIVFNNEH